MGRYRQAGLYAGAIVLLALSIYHFAYSSYHAGEVGFVDFSIFLREAESFLETGELYSHVDNMEAYAPATPVYKFPPLYAMLLLPVVAGGIPDNVYVYHWIVQLLFFLAAAALIPFCSDRKPSRRLLFLCALLALNFEPFFETLYRLQVETPILLLLALALCFHLKRRDALAGAALGFCIMLKIYPALLLLYFIVRRRWRAVAWCAGAMALIQVASLIIIGPEQNRLFFFKILPAMMAQDASLIPENLGIAGYIQQLAGIAPEAARRVSQLISLALLSLSLYALHRGGAPRGEGGRAALEYALFIPLLLLFMPNSWAHYQLLLLLPFMVALGRVVDGEGPRAEPGALLLAAYSLTLFYSPCAAAATGFPCAGDPLMLGLFSLPRSFHDGMVVLRVFSSLLLWLSCLLLLLGRSAAGARH